MRVGIVGAGPGGLISAYLLQRKYGDACSVTIFEACSRAGGMLQTRRFGAAPVPYEAGAAELYDYRARGADPLHDLIATLGLATDSTRSRTVVLDDRILCGEAELRRQLGADTFAAISAFYARTAALLGPDRWRPDDWRTGARHPWAQRSCADLIDEVRDPVAQRYLRILAHSDLAAEPHLTDGLTGLRKFALDVPGHVDLRAVRGGMGEIARALEQRICARIEANARVTAVEAPTSGCWRVHVTRAGRVEAWEFDAVLLALPAVDLARVEWRGATLRYTMDRHLARFDRPGHYLRVALLFDQPFWSNRVRDPWFIIDAFGGACVYDESARLDAGSHGVLGFLIAGNDAIALANANDDTIVERVLDSLPTALRVEARARWIEARVHRWIGAMCARPGGSPITDPRTAHVPDAVALPGLVLVGNYVFDSTLNGVYRSADFATTALAARIRAVARSGSSTRHGGHAIVDRAADGFAHSIATTTPPDTSFWRPPRGPG